MSRKNPRVMTDARKSSGPSNPKTEHLSYRVTQDLPDLAIRAGDRIAVSITWYGRKQPPHVSVFIDRVGDKELAAALLRNMEALGSGYPLKPMGEQNELLGKTLDELQGIVRHLQLIA